MNFPNIALPNFPGCSASPIDNSIKDEAVNGMSASRPRYSRQLTQYNLNWNAMTDADVNTLRAFFVATFGGSLSFNWTDIFGVSKVVRFDGSPTIVPIGAGLNQVSLTLKEA